MPTMKGGGEMGEEWLTVASAAWVLATWVLYPICSRLTASPVSGRRTCLPSKTTSVGSQPSMPAAMAQIWVFSSAQARSTAFPVM